MFWSRREATVDSSCWEFAWSALWNIQAGGRVGGLLCALTSPTAPGNASHSSSWQLLGHFQKTRGKKHSGIIFWSIWEPRAEGAKEARLKTHGWFFLCVFFCWSICGFSTSPSPAPPDTRRWSLQPLYMPPFAVFTFPPRTPTAGSLWKLLSGVGGNFKRILSSN